MWYIVPAAYGGENKAVKLFTDKFESIMMRDINVHLIKPECRGTKKAYSLANNELAFHEYKCACGSSYISVSEGSRKSFLPPILKFYLKLQDQSSYNISNDIPSRL